MLLMAHASSLAERLGSRSRGSRGTPRCDPSCWVLLVIADDAVQIDACGPQLALDVPAGNRHIGVVERRPEVAQRPAGHRRVVCKDASDPAELL